MAVIRAEESDRAMVVRVDRMTLQDVPEVMAVERDSFSAPWPASAYRRELSENHMARYIVLRLGTPLPPSTPVVETRGVAALMSFRCTSRMRLPPRHNSTIGSPPPRTTPKTPTS